MEALREASRALPGQARPRLVRFHRGGGIARVSHLHKEDMIRVLRSIRTIKSRRVVVDTLGTSGTIRKAIRKFLAPNP